MITIQLPPAITSVKEAQDFLKQLHDNGLAYHPEDDAADIVNYALGTPIRLFTDDEANQLNRLMEEIYDLNGNNGNHGTPDFDPCAYLLWLDMPESYSIAEIEALGDEAEIKNEKLFIKGWGYTLHRIPPRYFRDEYAEPAHKPAQPEYLFMATYPNAYVYCDKTKETRGDYHEIAFVYFRPLELRIADNSKKYAESIAIATADFERIKANIDQPLKVSASGQTVQPYLK